MILFQAKDGVAQCRSNSLCKMCDFVDIDDFRDLSSDFFGTEGTSRTLSSRRALGLSRRLVAQNCLSRLFWTYEGRRCWAPRMFQKVSEVHCRVAGQLVLSSGCCILTVYDKVGQSPWRGDLLKACRLCLGAPPLFDINHSDPKSYANILKHHEVSTLVSTNSLSFKLVCPLPLFKPAVLTSHKAIRETHYHEGPRSPPPI